MDASEIEFPATRSVCMRIFPGSNIEVEVQHDAALHLARLLARYNWALSDPAKYSSRWRGFWPKITQIERTLTVMAVRSANRGKFGSPFEMRDLPLALQSVASSNRAPKIDAAVASEFARLRHTFECALITPDDVAFTWWEKRSALMQVHEARARAALKAWWNDDTASLGLDAMLRGALVAAGVHVDSAATSALEMALDVDYLLQEREAALWRASAPRALH